MSNKADFCRYTWEKPNPFFLPALAAPRPLFLYAPGHYLKQFHAAYSDPEKLAALVDEAGLAAVMIAERIEGAAEDEIRATIEKVRQRAKNRQLRERAQKLLKSL